MRATAELENGNAKPVPTEVSQYWPLLLLVALLHLTSALAMTAANWADHLSSLTLVALLGVLTGATLARSRFPGWLAALFAFCYGVFLIGLQIGRTLGPIPTWHERSISLLGRLGAFIGVAVRNEANQDSLMFVLLMGALVWAMACFGGWGLLRHGSYWLLVLPPGLVLIVNAFIYVGPERMQLYLAAFVLLALILAVAMEIGRRWQGWRLVRAQVPPNAEVQLALPGIIAALALVGVAWLAPSATGPRSLSTLWQTLTEPDHEGESRLENLLASLRGGLAVGVSSYYGDDLALTAGEEPLDVLVLEVSPLGNPGLGGRFYWRSRTYDYYSGGTWTASTVDQVPFSPDGPEVVSPTYLQRSVVEVIMSPQLATTRQLQAPSQPLWVSRAAEFGFLDVGNGTGEVHEISADRTVYRGEQYRARASVAVPSAQALRSAGGDYPDWVLERYLQVPEAVTTRTRELASMLAEGHENNYDIVVAVTQWLRDNIAYSRVTLAPPEGREPIDWLLFDYRVGFCNYYASAEVILLRIMGIPARMAAGFARGTYDIQRQLYQVRGEDAHAWPEVFFPGYGWVEFEPTVSEEPLIRPELFTGLDPAAGTLNEGGQGAEDERLDRVEEAPTLGNEAGGAGILASWGLSGLLLRASIALIIIVVLPTLAWLKLDVTAPGRSLAALARVLQRLGFSPPELLERLGGKLTSPAESVYRRWSAWLPRLGVPLADSQTALERARLFASVYPQGEQSGDVIVHTYVQHRFGGIQVDEAGLKEAWLSIWPGLVVRQAWRILSLLFIRDRARS